MASLLDLVDFLLGDIFQDNLYSDTSPYRENISTPTTPPGAFGHIPNTDPRLLNLRAPVGFEHPHKEIAEEASRRVIPPDPMHGTHGTFTPTDLVESQDIHQRMIPQESDLNFSQRNEHPHKDLSTTIPQQPMHSTQGTFPKGPLNIKDAEGHPHDSLQDIIPREPEHPSPGSFSKGPLNLKEIPDHPHGGSDVIFPHDTKSDFSTDEGLITQTKRAEIYGKDRGSQDLIQELADFHQSQTHPPTPTFASDKRAGDSSFPPQNPTQNPEATHPGANADITNTFVGTPQRPLNFRGEDDAPDRLDLAAGFHAQKFGPNAEIREGQAFPQRHGTITDNRYDDTDTPFDGNFQSVFRGPVPQPLNYFNVVATGHWMRNIAFELGIPDPSQDGFQGGEQPDLQNPPDQGEPNVEGIAKGISFISTQFLLAAMNPMNPENGLSNGLWNPLSIGAAIPVLGSVDATNITAGAALGTGIYKDNALALEETGTSRLLLAREGLYSEINPLHRLTKARSPVAKPGFRGILGGPSPGTTIDDEAIGDLTDIISPTVQVDGGTKTDSLRQKGGVHTNLYTLERPYSADESLNNAVFPQEKLLEVSREGKDPGTEKLANAFTPVARGGSRIFAAAALQAFESAVGVEGGKTSAVIADWIAKPSNQREEGISSIADSPGVGHVGVIDAKLPGEPTEGGDGTSEEIADEEAIYMPFMFEDLREPEDAKKYLYFRAFLKGDINETFTPEWQTERFYGRVDHVPIYKGTVRSLNFTFDIAAFKPTDLPVIWQKMNKLQSMVYPSYDLRGFMEAGPMIRLRIGDLFAGSDRRGLPGYITGMDWSFPDGIWNIEKDYKVPRLITVAMTYTVIHSGNPGIYPRRAYELDPAGDLVGGSENDNIRTFGAGTFSVDGADAQVTKVQVSVVEVRKIFDTVK